jgi:ADP-ribose pyrophosphatase YjhB (NUDIX family)
MKIPEGDNRLRAVCDNCNLIHYENPKVVVGALATFEGKILLCKRAIEPKIGLWTLPAGYMELSETTLEGAVRETVEEAGADIEIVRLFAMHDLPFVNQVHIFFLAKMTSPSLSPGSESLEAKLFDVAEIPWENLAFKSVSRTLTYFIENKTLDEDRVYTSQFKDRGEK